MSDGAGPIVEELVSLILRVRARRRKLQPREQALRSWFWDCDPDLRRAEWEWPRWEL